MIGTVPDPLRPDEVRAVEIEKAIARGWDLTLLHGKKPLLTKWQDLPPLPLETILSHARKDNVGLRTGRSYGIVVLDDDTDDLRIAAELNLPPTVTVVTGSGKRHYYFHYEGEPFGNRTGALPPGVDVRGEGGQVVYPGSIHPDTGLPYEWLPGHSPDEIDIAELPEHVVALIRTRVRRKKKAKREKAPNEPGHPDASKAPKEPRQARRSGANRRLQSYAVATIGYIVSDIQNAPVGTRNQMLNDGAFTAGRFVGLGLLARERVEADLTTAATNAGLEPDEIESTLRSALDAGIAQAGTTEELLEDLDENTLGLPPSDEDRRLRPILVLIDSERHHAIDAILDLLREQDPPIVFEQLGRLVCLVPAVMHRRNGAAAHGVCVRSLDDVYLPDLLGRLLRFRHRTMEIDVPVNCPASVAKTVLARAAHGKLPALTQVICTPTLRPDGSLLATPGYDAQTGLFLDIAPDAFGGVPEHPTRDDALRALAELKEPFEEFDFETDADRSVFLAALLTPFVRWHLRTSPMFVITAPRRGSGKTLLARAVGLIATGRAPWTLTQEHSDEESRKRWFAMLLMGATIVNIDNLEAPLGGATLCTILTEDRLTDRVLGVSQVQTVDTTKLVLMATGNNVEIAGDLTRRVLFCRIDPGVEFPEDRHFKRNLDQYLLDHRQRLVVAALTVLRAFVEAGRPLGNARPFGSFEEWSDLVRATLIWLDEPDPCRTRVTLEEGDAEREWTQAFIDAWVSAFGEAELTAGELIASVGDEAAPAELRALAIALQPICGIAGGGLDAVSLGRWLRRIRNRVQSGYRVEVASRAHGKVRWRVRRV